MSVVVSVNDSLCLVFSVAICEEICTTLCQSTPAVEDLDKVEFS